MDQPEIILNLWYVHHDMGYIYSLRVRCYIGVGNDQEKLRFLQQHALWCASPRSLGTIGGDLSKIQ